MIFYHITTRYLVKMEAGIGRKYLLYELYVSAYSILRVDTYTRDRKEWQLEYIHQKLAG